MEEITRYVTFDGIEFGDKKKAEEHERLLKTLDIVKIEFNRNIKNILDDTFNFDEDVLYRETFDILVQKAESYDKIKHCLEIMFGPSLNYASDIQNWDMERQETTWVGDYNKVKPRFILVTYKKDNYEEIAGGMGIPIINKKILNDIYDHYITQIISRTVHYL